MEIKLYLILLSYFLIGGVAMAMVNKGKETEVRQKNWLKYVVYLLLINVLFGSILFAPRLFHLLSLLIITLGFLEILYLTYQLKKIRLGLQALLIFSLLSFSFYNFSFLPERYLFYTLFLTTVFDAFSQLSGQLFGRRKLAPKISPNKTFEGFLGGLIFALITSVLLHKLLLINIVQSLLLGLGLSGGALLGDLLASYCKRRFNVKDFSNLIPGHGGVLDRFDSFIAAGSILLLLNKMLGI